MSEQSTPAKERKTAAAWGLPAHNEPRWPASAAALVAAIFTFSLPQGYAIGPVWLLPILELAILIPLSIVAPLRRKGEPPWQRYAAVALIALASLANTYALFVLVQSLVQGTFHGHKIVGRQLLLSSGSIWLTNVLVFGLWYWELDRGGPDERSDPEHRAPDFLFPQMSTPNSAPARWYPVFLDYVYIAFTNATAFSPTDTMPLTPWAKMLMAVQAITSLLTIALVAARAVNILTG